MNYGKYSDEELIVSYTTMMDYSAKDNDEISAEIQNRGGLDNFLDQITLKEKHKKEVGRSSKAVLRCV